MANERPKWSAEEDRRWQEGWRKFLQVRQELEAQKPKFLDPGHATREERRAYSDWFGQCIRQWEGVLCGHQREEGNPELENALHDVFARFDAARNELERADK